MAPPSRYWAIPPGTPAPDQSIQRSAKLTEGELSATATVLLALFDPEPLLTVSVTVLDPDVL